MSFELRMPAPWERPVVGVAVVTWVGALAGLEWGMAGLTMGLLALSMPSSRRLLVVVALTGAVTSGALAASRIDRTLSADLVSGPISLRGRLTTDPLPARYGLGFVLRPEAIDEDGSWVPWSGPELRVSTGTAAPPLAVGDLVSVEGIVHGRPGRLRTVFYAGYITASEVVRVSGPDPHLVPGNFLRSRLRSQLSERHSRGVALLGGLLIGDVAALSAGELEDLRRSGLTHFVAVSGGNVAIFLAGWWLLTLPLGLRPRARAATGIAALGIFVVATRWEPSVVRAATMALVVLGGRVAGVPVGPWSALGTAVVVLLMTSGQLAADLGFQLSAAATAGVIAGSGLFRGRKPSFAWSALGATLAAQAAVLPLLLRYFGSVPLVAPVTNVLAAPLVAGATAVGGLGAVLGVPLLIDLGGRAGDVVLAIARAGAAWPQLSGAAVAGVGVVAVVGRIRVLRPLLLAAGLVAVGVAMPRPPPWPSRPTVAFLDVGQGDATLLRSPDGHAILVDGGRDPGVLRRHLDGLGVARLDLVVATHGDLDHVGGLPAVLSGRVPGELWLPGDADLGPALEGFAAHAGALGTVVRSPSPDSTVTVGSFRVTVIGPVRRYAGDNDGSLVVWVEAGRSLLLAGDVEAVAQRDLPGLDPDVLLVPHHGSATTDPGWLAETAGDLAVISVGENPYGHPSREILGLLERQGVPVVSTAEEGTIEIGLG